MLAFHAAVPRFAGGYVGVDVFYVISGFLITGLMVRDADSGTRRHQLAEFYARRIRRIMPAATVVVLLTLAGSMLLLNGIENVRAASDARSATLFYSNHHFVGSSDYFFAPNGPSLFQQYWSLSVEEQFYAVWPLLFLSLATISATRLRIRVVAIGATVASIVSFVISVAWTRDDTWLSLAPSNGFYLLPSRAWELGIGALLALGATRVARIPARMRTPLATSGAVALVASIVLYDNTTSFPGVAALLPTLGTAAVIAAGTGADRPPLVNRLLSTGIAQWIGRYSFALYLIHWPVLLLLVARSDRLDSSWFLRGIAMTALTVPASMALYHVVEDPMRRAPALRRPARAFALGAAMLLVSVALIAATTPLTRDSLRTSRTAAPVTKLSPSPEVTPTDFVPANLVPSLFEVGDNDFSDAPGCPRDCVVGATGSARRVTIIGDSLAEHLMPGLDLAATKLGFSVHERILRGCPIFEELDDSDCGRFHRTTLRRLQADPPDVIVLASRHNRAFDASASDFVARIDARLRSLPSESEVVVVGATPFSSFDVPRCLADHLHAAGRCDLTWPDDISAAMRPRVESAGAHFLDLRPVLCAATRCPAITANRLIWADRDHLTRQHSRSLGLWLASEFKPLLAN